MKKTIITLSAVLFSFLAMAQERERSFDLHTGNWEIAALFGSINFDNTATVNVQDNINIGFTVEGTRKFKNNLFLNAGVSFSSGKELGELYENPLTYFSVNADVGYRFKLKEITKPFVVPYVAIGGSYINAANTLPNADSSYSINTTVGFIFWLNQSNFGLTIRDTYKFVESDYMVNHNQILVGLRYKL
ncbi:outer membrane beta-barrel protein [Polaribacter sp. Z022]|uniref:outer membrane beta-barrel protein n=1 Tax=Polaribacter sp. Z022 TaxID=2927125 RepID=UPI00201FDB04|nr:outer membrane beta-barrel protein [Polaribacter sp. Z022]MCL7753302.1 porin family protein [Polaribacter sp. Z022]